MRDIILSDIEPHRMSKKESVSVAFELLPTIPSPIHSCAIEISHGMKKIEVAERFAYERVELDTCRINPFDFTFYRPTEAVNRVVHLLSKISAQYYHPWTSEMKMTLKQEATNFVGSWDGTVVPRFRDFEHYLEERISERTESTNLLNMLSSVNTSLQVFDRHRILSCVQFITQLQSPLKTYFHDYTSVPLLRANQYLHIVVPESKTAWEELLLEELISHYEQLFNQPINESKDERGFNTYLIMM